jgi:hypothetical protein
VHLDLLHPTSFTHFTSASLRIERESSRSVSSLQSLMSCCEDFAYVSEYSGICGNIRMGGFPYGRLIDDDRFIDIIESFDAAMFSDMMCRSIEVILKCDREYVYDK